MKKLAVLTLILLSAALAQATSPKLPAEVKPTKNKYVQGGAYVEKTERLNTTGKVLNTDVKLFSVLGGDPAMNGTLLNVAVYVDAEQGYKVFELANVYDYKITKQYTDSAYVHLTLEREFTTPKGKIYQVKSLLIVDLTNAKKGVVTVLEREL